MDRKLILENLAFIADRIDRDGFHREADTITQIMQRVAEDQGMDPMNSHIKTVGNDLSDPLISQNYSNMVNDLSQIGVDVPSGISFEDLQELHDANEKHMHHDPDREPINPFLNHTSFDPGF